MLASDRPSRTSRPRAAADASEAAHSTASDEAARNARLDGRRTHILDRATEYVRLADQGLTVTRIARRRRKSKAYVSILLRLGRALEGIEPGDRAALRSPRITWALAQRIVRRDTDVMSIRSQLRDALGGFSTHNVDRRKHRAGRTRAPAPVVGVAWRWDEDWFARDPAGYAAAHLEHLRSVHTAVHGRAERAVARRGTGRLAVGQSLRALQRATASAGTASQAATAAEQYAVAAFEILARKLGEARSEIAALGLAAGEAASAEPETGPAASRIMPLSRSGSQVVRSPVQMSHADIAAEIADDLGGD